MKVTIVKTGINGEGIAYVDHKPVFIPGAFPGEVAEIWITDREERFSRAKLIHILKPSPSRIPSPCVRSDACGGCPLIELEYTAQLAEKRRLLCEALWKYGHVRESFVREVHGSEDALGYRSALKLPTAEEEGLLVTGMYRTGTNHFVSIDTCPAHDPTLEAIRKTVLAIIHEEHLPSYDQGHGIRYLIMRRIDKQIAIALITGKDTLPESFLHKLSLLPEVESIVQSVNTAKTPIGLFGRETRLLYGSNLIHISFAGFPIQLSAESFFQLNLKQAEALYQMAVSKVDECHVLAEAYCGVGVMSLMAKDKARKVYGIESVPQAIENAKANAKASRVPNVTFLCDDAAKGLERLLNQTEVDILLADPPRSGMDRAMLETIRNSSIQKIIYVSCNPATLGKNIHELKSEYDVKTVIPFDLFPNTPHVESVTVLVRRGHSDRRKGKRRNHA
ncbi:MAG: 23S rRNA (uracil(1939)-C(5))-methyltransferase RlmD [Solobacterium sp.]|nr:23S rRNA (uracil(1939)-C(5))-methyltransferase RlmD [Solobacterium sp.]